MILDGLGLAAHEVVDEAMLERRLRQVEALDLEAPMRIEEAIDRRREEALEIAVPKQDSTFVLAHGELANEQHGPSPQTKSPGGATNRGFLFRP